MLGALASPSIAQSPSDLFQRALVQERIAGKLDSAIVLYQRVVRQAGSDRALAARALLGLGRAYELLGRTEARVAYDRLVRDYPDQRDAVTQARARIAALSPAPARNRPAPSTVPEIRRVWAGPGNPGESPPWPGGSFLAFVDPSSGRVAVHDFATGRDRRLTEKDSSDSPGGNAQTPLVSPDGKQVAYSWYVPSKNPHGGYELRIVPIEGGRPRMIPLRGVQSLNLHAWSSDSKGIVALVIGASETDRGTLAVIDVADGTVHRLRTFPRANFAHADMSPDGKWIAFDVPANDELGRPSDIHVIATDGTREHALVEHPAWDWAPFWTPDGRGLVFMSDRTGGWSAWLLGVVDGVAQGEPRLLKADMGGNDPLGFARDGSFLYSPVGLKEVELVTLDPETGAAIDQPHIPSQALIGNHMMADWSPDGRSLVLVSIRGNGKTMAGNRVLETIDLATGHHTEFTFPFGFFFNPRWSPDGRAILLPAENRYRPSGVYFVDAETGAFKFLFARRSPNQLGAEWSANSQSIFYVVLDSLHASIWRYDLADSSQHLIYQSATTMIHSIAPSKDGKFLALSEGRVPVLKLLSLGDGSTRDLPFGRSNGESVARGYYSLNWTPDGELLAIRPRFKPGVIMELWRIPIDGRAPRKLAHEAPQLFSMRLSPDGHRIAYYVEPDTRALSVWAIRNFLPPSR